MAELHRYVDEAGNVFSMTAEDARQYGLKPYVPPEAAAKARAAPADKELDAPPEDKGLGGTEGPSVPRRR